MPSCTELFNRLPLFPATRSVFPVQQSSEADLSLDGLLARNIRLREAGSAKELIHFLESPTFGLWNAEIHPNGADDRHYSKEYLARCQ